MSSYALRLGRWSPDEDILLLKVSLIFWFFNTTHVKQHLLNWHDNRMSIGGGGGYCAKGRMREKSQSIQSIKLWRTCIEFMNRGF